MNADASHKSGTVCKGHSIECTNCKVQYPSPADVTPTHTVCPVCSNRQPYGWARPASPGALKAPETATPPRDATEAERSQIFATLSWYAYHMPHVADAAFPRDVTVSSARTIPIAKTALLGQWEERKLESKTRPYKGEALPQLCTEKADIDPWEYEWPLRDGVVREPYADSRDLPETFAATTCTGCSGDKTVQCRKCSGAGRHRCPDCNATQRVRCQQCKGSGTFTRYEYTEQFGTCSTCGGRGQYADLLGNQKIRERMGSGVSNTCRSCWGRGQRTERVRHAIKGTCGRCRGDGAVDCTKCDEQGHVACDPCLTTGRVKCTVCDGDGRVLGHVELQRKCSSEACDPCVAWPESELENADIRSTIRDALTPAKGQLDTTKWPIVLHRIGTPKELRASCEGDLAVLPFSQPLLKEVVALSERGHSTKRLQRVEVEVRQTVVVGLQYAWNEVPYAHWAISLVPVRIDNRTPLYDRTVGLCNEALDLWKCGKREEAITKARFCLDIAKKDRMTEHFLGTCQIPEELLSSAKSQAWKVFGSATTNRVVAGTTAAVKAVSGWVGGLFGGKKAKSIDSTAVQSPERLRSDSDETSGY